MSLTESSISYDRIISPFFWRMYYKKKGCMNELGFWISSLPLVFIYVRFSREIESCVRYRMLRLRGASAWEACVRVVSWA
jgi:hypothetical protein